MTPSSLFQLSKSNDLVNIHHQVLKSSYSEILVFQKHWLDFLNSISIRPPKLAYNQRDGMTPGKRLEARKYYEPFPWQYRVILHNEVFYDLDVVDWDLLQMLVNPVLKVLYDNEIPYILAGSGGSKSLHIHIFVKPVIWFVRYTWREVRYQLWNWILDQAKIPKEMRGDGKWSLGSIEAGDYFETNYPFDSSCINFSDLAVGGRVVRDFGGTKNDGLTRKTVILEDLPDRREDIYKGDYITMPAKVKLWDATDIIERELEFKLNEPEDCDQCPVVPEWMLQYDLQLDREGFPAYISDYPRICRECGKYRIERRVDSDE